MDRSFDVRQYEIPDGRLIELVEESHALGTKNWHIAGGGEPLMRGKVLLSMMEKIKSFRMNGDLTTNGTLFNLGMIQFLIDIKWDLLCVSLDGPDQQTNDFLRPPAGTFNRVISMLEQFRVLKEKSSCKNPCVIIHCVISSANYTKLIEMVRLAAAYKADGILFDFIRRETPVCDPLLFDKKAYAHIVQEQIDKAKIIVGENQLRNNLADLETALKKYVHSSEAQQSNKHGIQASFDWLNLRCYQPWHNIMIMSNGDTSPCCLIFPFSQDNVKKKNLSEIWLGEAFRSFREGLAQHKLPNPCIECNATLQQEAESIRWFMQEAQKNKRKTVLRREKALHVCLVSREYPPDTGWGGIGTYTYHLAHGLVESGYDVHVICQSLDLDRDCDDNGVHVHRVSHKSIFPFKGKFREFGLRWEYSRSVYYKLKEVIDKYNIDIVEAPNFSGEGFVYSFHKKVPLVTRLHTHFSEVINFLGWGKDLDRRLSCWFENAAVLRSDLVICSTKPHAESVAREVGIHPKKIKIIPLGIPIPDIQPGKQANPRPLILFVGRLEKRKGVHVLIEAAPHILKAIPDAEIVIIGRDSFISNHDVSFAGLSGRSFKEQLVKMIPDEYRERVKFLGYVSNEELSGYYRNCDVFVAPSLYESFGLIYIEAMSYAKPVIGCGVGGVPEVIQDGVTGILVPPQDALKLANAVVGILKDKPRAFKIGQAAREYARKYFSRDAMVENTVDAYAQVCQLKAGK